LSNPYLGEIRMMSFDFAPKGWQLCNGQTLPINQNAALFALLGTTYGGNGTSTFQLPNLQSSAPIHFGGAFAQGETGGVEQVALSLAEMASHNHPALAVNVAGATAKPLPSHVLAQSGSGNAAAYAPPNSLTPLNPNSIQPAGSGATHSNIQPYLTVNFCIALTGIFPSRN
jgi:microcystin-dependent protein